MTEQQLREQLDAVYASTSWKITAPFRFFVSLIKSTGLRLGSPLKTFLAALHWAARQPRLRYWGLRILRRFPTLEKRIRNIILSRCGRAQSAFPTPSLAQEEQLLTPAAQVIYREMRVAFQNAK